MRESARRIEIADNDEDTAKETSRSKPVVVVVVSISPSTRNPSAELFHFISRFYLTRMEFYVFAAACLCKTRHRAYRRCFGELTNTGFLNFVDSISAAVCLTLTSIFGTGLRSPVPALAFAIVPPGGNDCFYFSSLRARTQITSPRLSKCRHMTDRPKGLFRTCTELPPCESGERRGKRASDNH